MTDELRPISYQGFMNMVQRLWGSSFDPLPLAEKPLASVTSEQNGERLVFTLADGRTLTYTAEGDCCSSSWVEHLTVPSDIAGVAVTGISERDMGETDDNYDTIRVYETAFTTPKGEIVVEYRNRSNGYYGGWLQGPIEDWAIEESRRLRDKHAAASS